MNRSNEHHPIKSLLSKYHTYVNGKGGGYFEVDEYLALADHYRMQEDLKEAMRAITLGLSLHPHSLRLSMFKAKLHLENDELNSAKEILHIYRGHSDNVEYLLTELHIRTKEKNIKTARDKTEQLLKRVGYEDEELIQHITTLFSTIRTEESLRVQIDILKRAYKKNRDSNTLLLELGKLHLILIHKIPNTPNADTENAIKIYNRLIDVDTFNKSHWKELGLLYLHKQNYPKAIECFDYYLVFDKDDSFILPLKALSHAKLGDYHMAIETYTSMNEEETPLELLLWRYCMIASYYEELKDFENALIYYEKALKIDAQNYDALTGATECLLELDNLPLAKKKALFLTLRYRHQSYSWVLLAEVYKKTGKEEKVLYMYLKALEIDKDMPEIEVLIGTTLFDQEDYATALYYYEKSYSPESNLDDLLETYMAASCYMIGNKEKYYYYIALALEKRTDAYEIVEALLSDIENKTNDK